MLEVEVREIYQSQLGAHINVSGRCSSLQPLYSKIKKVLVDCTQLGMGGGDTGRGLWVVS